MDWLLMADMSYALSLSKTIFLVAAGLGFVIFVHELGHFLAAKACGVKCEKFYIGFDIPMPLGLPSSLCRFQWGETEYGVGILPLGGYVKMLGQDDNPATQAQENERIKVRKPESGEVPDSPTSATPKEGTTPSDPTEASLTLQASSSEEGEFELDPRSYPARPVWQRMIIISAGVVMNLIFAVIFATVAYEMGVSYTPCILGGTAPGNPAWIAGISPGDQILQLHRDGHPDEQLRFEKDLMMTVVLNGAHREMDLLVRSGETGEDKWYTFVPADRRTGPHKRATLGVFGPRTTKLSAAIPVYPIGGRDDVAKRFQPGDEIIAVDGTPLPRDKVTGAILDIELDAILAQRMLKPLTLSVLRQPQDTSPDAQVSEQQVEIEVPPTRLRMTGLIMETAPILKVRHGSPADEAGFKEGDRLLTIAGEDLGDPLTLAQRMLAWIGQEIEVRVRREGQERTLHVTPQLPQSFMDNFLHLSPVGLETLGIALPVDSVVREVEPASPAAKAGLKPGDRIMTVQFYNKKQEKDGEPVPLSEVNSDQQLVSVHNWYYVHHALQQSGDLMIELVVHRPATPESGRADVGETGIGVTGTNAGTDAGTIATLSPIRLESTYSDRWFYADRGFHTTSFSRVRTAKSLSEACALGWRETRTSLIQVVLVLQRLFTGQISVRSMGGPLTIATVAGSEASKGIARLLTFLTFLSANLAILNFLPIPALDGGHMVFLAAEGIRGKPVNERLQITLTLVGVFCLLSLMALVFTNDLQFLFFR